jgi:UDP-N-acetylmuramyl pentapeptide phosphotransferase/UDP-N-acetylglucosamine-1-phosphate transferase
MILFEQFIIILIAVHLFTTASFYGVKRSKISNRFKSSSDHPANVGNTASQLGGLVIVPVTLCACFLIFKTFNKIPYYTQLVFCMPYVLLYVTGIIDDFKPIPAWIRLTIHIANSFSITIVIFGLTNYDGLGVIISTLGFILPSIFMVLAISWLINAVNFIDGMDLFLVVNIIPGCLLFSVLGMNADEFYFISVIYLVFSSALLGFVWFNRPVASIYMGDAGTLCIGLLLSSSAVYILAEYGSIAGFIPFTYIMVDTTYTLLHRAIKGLNVLKSHNHHAYQIAMRNGKTKNSIRLSCFLVSIANAGLAYVCFAYEHAILWQILMAGIALGLSTLTFVFFRKANTIGA